MQIPFCSAHGQSISEFEMSDWILCNRASFWRIVSRAESFLRDISRQFVALRPCLGRRDVFASPKRIFFLEVSRWITYINRHVDFINSHVLKMLMFATKYSPADSKLKLDGRVAIVTGVAGPQGMGYASAKKLVGDGAI